MKEKTIRNLTLRAERKPENPSQKDLWNDIRNPELVNITTREW